MPHVAEKDPVTLNNYRSIDFPFEVPKKFARHHSFQAAFLEDSKRTSQKGKTSDNHFFVSQKRLGGFLLLHQLFFTKQRTMSPPLRDEELDNSSAGSSSFSASWKDVEESRSGSTTSASNSNDKQSQSSELAGRESAVVFRLRLLVIFTILMAAIGVSLAVYFLTSTSEQSQFEQQFDGAASKIATSFSEIIDAKFSAILSLACNVLVG